MLRSCLPQKEKLSHEIQDLEDKIESHKSTKLLLSVKVEQLQKQLEESQLQQQKLGKRIEIMLMYSPKTPT